MLVCFRREDASSNETETELSRLVDLCDRKGQEVRLEILNYVKL